MIQYVKQKQIDKGRWDDCVAKAVNSRVYAFSWYLDRVSPGWEGLITHDYQCVFPLTRKVKAGIPYLAQPFFAQQLGLFTSLHLTPSLVQEFLEAIPGKYRFIEIHLNEMNKVNPADFPVRPRLNHELDLIREYPDLYSGYSQNTRRNLRKAAERNIRIGRKTEADELISLFRITFGDKEGKLKFRHYAMLQELIQYCTVQGMGHILGAYDTEGRLTASAFILKAGSRLYFLFAASAPEARENGGMFLLLDHLIRTYAGQAMTLDFEGGNDHNLGRFYKSFGALECSYTLLQINRLPWFINKGVNFVKKFRHSFKV